MTVTDLTEDPGAAPARPADLVERIRRGVVGDN